jgi:stage III sporulation protein AF
MDALSGYVLSIVGVVILGVIINIIMPEGSMSKYIQNIFALITVFVIISPVSVLMNSNFDTSSIIDSANVQIDQNFIYLVNSQTINQLEYTLEKELDKEGYFQVCVTISANLIESPLLIKKVNADLTNLVIKPELQHINKYNKIKQIILNFVNVKEEQIVFYG